ncbi:MAG: emopamil-binding family protein [Chloroflexota bacterium]
MRTPIPLRCRKIDYLIIAFFILNLGFITYIVDAEQIIIPDPYHFEYPVWPPRPFVDMVHNYGQTLDPVLMARPAWWRMTIWIDALFFGPFYALAIYAFIKGKEWIRLISFIWGSMLITNVLIILSEEIGGSTPTPQLPLVLLLNLPWLLLPMLVMFRLGRTLHPFTEAVAEAPARVEQMASANAGRDVAARA